MADSGESFVIQPLQPIAGRPHMPEGYGVPQTNEGLLDWRDVHARFAAVKVYWIGTTWPDGRPHAIPIWGAFIDDHFFCEGGPDTRWGRNIAANPLMNAHAEIGELCVMIDGAVTRVESLEPALFERVADAFAAKYPYRPESSAGMCVLRPRVAFAWDQFPGSATRWHFGPA
jgi:hypothetical protein